MGLEMVLNELSMFPLAKDVYTARLRMAKFIETLVVAVSLKVDRALRIEGDINVIELASGYRIASWRNDPEVDRDIRRYFRSLTTKAPYLQDVSNPEILDTYDLSDFFYSHEKAKGLGIAFLLDALAISFHSHSAWETSVLQLRFEQLREDEVVDDLILIKHASSKNHVLEHRDWIKKRAQMDIRSGADLWTHRESLYPHLHFCQAVATQLQALQYGDIHIKHIIKHLQILNEYCETWQGDAFSKQTIALDISTESQATLQQFSNERTFVCPDNVPRVFSWHSKVYFLNWRIYFYPIEQEKAIIIGYIGRHRATVKFPT